MFRIDPRGRLYIPSAYFVLMWIKNHPPFIDVIQTEQKLPNTTEITKPLIVYTQFFKMESRAIN